MSCMEVSKIISKYEALNEAEMDSTMGHTRCKSWNEKSTMKEKRHKNITEIRRPRSHHKLRQQEKYEPLRIRGNDNTDNTDRLSNKVISSRRTVPNHVELYNEKSEEIVEQVEHFGAKLKKRLSKSNDIMIDEIKVPVPEEDKASMFELNDFEEESEDNYIVEGYNPVLCGIEGQELVFVSLSITRRSVSSVHEEELQDMMKDSDLVIFKNDAISNNHDSLTVPPSFLYNDNFSHSPSSDPYNVYESPVSFQNHFKEERNGLSRSNSQKTEELHSNEDEIISKKEKMTYIVEELIQTEEQYITGLEKVLNLYKPYIRSNIPSNLIGRDSYMFGNIEEIQKNSKKFLEIIKERSQDPEDLAQAFCDSAADFDLYPLYSKNKPRADMCIREFDKIIKERQEQLTDKLGLSSYLLTPIQRLGKYLLLLRQMKKEFQKKGKPLEKIDRAIDVIQNVMRKGNDYIAVDSIKEAEIDIASKGSFIMRSLFNILKPRKLTSMVFLFENVIVLTENVTRNIEQFKYVDSIPISELCLGVCEDKPTIFHLTNYSRAKKFPATATYVIEAESPKIKNEWTGILQTKLWTQLKKAKEEQKQYPVVAERHTMRKFATEPRKQTRMVSKIERRSSGKATSKFYDLDGT